MQNPLLTQNELPAFSSIAPEHVEPAIDALLEEGRALIKRMEAVAGTASWEGFVEVIEDFDDRLSRAWSPASHLNSVMNSDELRAAYNACLPKLSAYATEIGHNATLFQGYKHVCEQQGLDAAQRKMLVNTLRDLHLAGVDLDADKKARFAEIAQEMSALGAKYSENLLDATNAWTKLITDADDLAGLPESALSLARQNAEQRDHEQGWLLTLDAPCFQPVLTYADNRALRHEMYQAYTTRASDQGPNAGEWDNGEVMERILALRHEQAQLLGFDNFAELSLEPKMAESPAQVLEFLEDLGRRSLPQARAELEAVRHFGAEFGVSEPLEPWDIGYYAEKLRHARFEISQEELRPYFPATKVIPGMFQVAERLFDIRIREIDAFDSYHPDVKLFEIVDDQGQPRARFYLDAYARRNKRGGAWMDTCANRMRSSTREQLPVAFLVCNFTPPIGDKPALLTHNEVETLFHEFGHGLHHMLTQVDYPPVGGINGVPWDAVELPSQFMENWCWERESLDLFARHVDSGEPIPEPIYQRMRAAKTFQSAMMMIRQLEFAIFDLRLHLEYDPDKGARIYDILDQVREQVAVIQPPGFNRFAHSFAHIFAGGYAAGYYSYKWAEVLSADAFSLFEEHGIFDPATGKSFRENILERGGSADAMDLFRAFRGREPSADALLRHSGIGEAKAA